MSEEKTVDKNNWLQNVVSSLNVYEFEEKLPGSKRLIKFKPITPAQLKIFLQNENVKDPEQLENIIDRVINGSVVSDDFDVDNLYIQDRIFLFLCMRIRSKGNILEINKTCKKCGSQYSSSIDLTHIDCKELSDDVDYTIKINKNLSIEMQLLKRKDMKDIYAYIRKNKYKDEKERDINIAFVAYAASIKSISFDGKVNEDLSLEDKSYFLNNIAENIFDIIVKWNDDNDFGIKISFEDICPHCGYTEQVKITASELM